jgi:hypothetical protein
MDQDDNFFKEDDGFPIEHVGRDVSLSKEIRYLDGVALWVCSSWAQILRLRLRMTRRGRLRMTIWWEG